MPDRARDWLSQADRDLRQAEVSKTEGIHEWACFAAQQAHGPRAVLIEPPDLRTNNT